MTQLQALNLQSTPVTDAGLEHLKGLTQLQALGLWCTQVSDAGLEHLKGLTQLQSLGLAETRVTDAGEVGLKKGTAELQDSPVIPEANDGHRAESRPPVHVPPVPPVSRSRTQVGSWSPTAPASRREHGGTGQPRLGILPLSAAGR